MPLSAGIGSTAVIPEKRWLTLSSGMFREIAGLLFCLWLPVCTAQSLPRISTNGILNAAGAPLPPAPVAPGTIISIYGANFNSTPGTHAGGVSASSLPLPTSLSGTQVVINSLAAPLYYADSSQINAQVPWEVNGASNLSVQVVVNGVRSNLATVPLTTQAPGIFLVTHALDGSLVTPARPAVPDEYLTIFGLGLGPVTNPPATGAAAIARTLSYTLTNPVVAIGGTPAKVVFSGLTPGLAGLYQVNAQVPPGIPNGDDVTVVLGFGGAISNTITTSAQAGIPSGVKVSVSPVSVSILTGTTQQFTATVSGSSNSSVNWTVNGISGGNPTVGTISSSGLYTAPATVPSGNLAFVAAGSAAETTVAGSATATVSAPSPLPSPLGRSRSAAPGLWVQFEERGWPSQWWTGQAIQIFNQFDPVVGTTVSAEISMQLDKMKAMGLNSITIEFRSADDPTNRLPFIAPACPIGTVLGLNWPQPTSIELTNLKAFFDLVQSKGMKVRVHLVDTHMEEQPPTNSTTWLGAILGVIGKHAALDVVMFDGDEHLVLSSPLGPKDKCGGQAEPALWYGPDETDSRFITWAMGYALSLGVPARRLSAEAIVGNIFTDSLQRNCCATDGHFWNTVDTLRIIFDRAGIPMDQRTYALSFYEHSKCSTAGNLPCTELDAHSWAEQTMQTVYGIIGAGNGARIVATELGDAPPVSPTWKSEWALESLVALMGKYGVDGGSFWRWTSFETSEDADRTLADAVKRRGVDFVYNPVQKEVLDWGGFHLTSVPNGSFEDDVAPNGVPTQWTQFGNGTAAAYFLAQEPGQPQVASRGTYCLRLTTGASSSSTVSALSQPISVTPGTAYTTTANMRFSWTGDPQPSGSSTKRPQVFATIHYLRADGQPASVPSTSFLYFQENSTQGFQTFVFQYTPPADARSVQIEIGAARNGLGTAIILDADNLR